MKEYAVFSGKGGTGKTSLVASFARLAPGAVAVDCDVDAANLALLLPGEDEPERPFFSGWKARIDPQRCSGCGACAGVCRFDALTPAEGIYRVASLACEGCRVCATVCPEDAITFEDNQAGHWTRRRTDHGWLVHASLGIAQDNSGKLVAQVKEEARLLASRESAPFVLVDGPPGIGCPVHAAISQVERILAVTEPTPSGLHDLDRLLDLAAHFQVDAVVAINKWDLAPAMSDEIQRTSEARAVPVVGRIPFDEDWPTLLARAEVPLKPPARPDTVEAIRTVARRFLHLSHVEQP